MKKLLLLLPFLAWSFSVLAQEPLIPQRYEIVELETDDGDTTYEVINMRCGDQNQYWLNVGLLGHGDEIVQVVFDPVFHLYIPLGDTLDEAIENLTQLRDLSKEKLGTTVEMTGCLTPLIPKADKLETVTVTVCKPILTRHLEFILQREGYVRATYVSKSTLSSLLSSLKIYRKLHPRE